MKHHYLCTSTSVIVIVQLFNFYIISQLYCDFPIHKRIFKEKYFEFIIYIIEHGFDYKAINIQIIIDDEVALFVYFHMYNNHITILNYPFFSH